MHQHQAIRAMSPQQAIRILMLSPCYWLLNPPERNILVKEYCAAHAVAVATTGVTAGEQDRSLDQRSQLH
ncbi:hypothetical protein [Desulfogranum mediterraneum]|uniref:hypothetical protein n=1 Tax=Desulfogranum mediterraneum TaxID=160661 RepID=UPI000404B743|nr:hypothetical protein [Desulfogranum mediterraneum]